MEERFMSYLNISWLLLLEFAGTFRIAIGNQISDHLVPVAAADF